MSLSTVLTRGFSPASGASTGFITTLGYGTGAVAPPPTPPAVVAAARGGAPVWWCEDDEECDRRQRKYSEMTEERLLAGRREIGLIAEPVELEEAIEEILEVPPPRIAPPPVREPFAPDVRKIVERVRSTIRGEIDREIARRREERALDDEQAVAAATDILLMYDDE